ncbi:MAG: hypothetical protein V4532_01730 [Pseudomonadota bacterium]
MSETPSTKPAALAKKAVAKKTVAKPAKAVKAVKPAVQPVVKKAPLVSTTTTTKAKVAPKQASVDVMAAAPAKPAKPKQKLVRDSFTMPSVDFALIDHLKERAIGFKRPAKKSELLRAGLQALVNLSDAKLTSLLDGLVPLKPGRPKKTPE